MTAEELQRIVLDELASRAYRVSEDSYSMSDDPALPSETADGKAPGQTVKEPRFEVGALLDYKDYIDFKNACKSKAVHISAHWQRMSGNPDRFYYEIVATPWKYNRAVFTATILVGLIVGQWISQFFPHWL